MASRGQILQPYICVCDELYHVSVCDPVASPALSVANEVDKAKVDISVGAVNIEAGDRATILNEGT